MNNKIYIVMSDFGYDTKNFEGAFSTPEKAQEYTEYMGKCSGCKKCYWWEEEEIDNP
ncbi:hypothetical protein Spock_256 [Bacillus phage Spock]|uniref:DUF7336 domain-containing protein n=2 Tax=Bequatrovirus spock TaxID=1918008 RepID=A0A1X9SGI1_9CAUD|nr:hypothetical protein Spock_256 [Bacillus phage Spock]AGY48656.1 hypothetical protein Spock_256 [Bacillus phage Spock]ARQ95171.1 hypothetical protein FLAPJACK_260 [Bacillus phage Flapjack]